MAPFPKLPPLCTPLSNYPSEFLPRRMPAQHLLPFTKWPSGAKWWFPTSPGRDGALPTALVRLEAARRWGLSLYFQVISELCTITTDADPRSYCTERTKILLTVRSSKYMVFDKKSMPIVAWRKRKEESGTFQTKHPNNCSDCQG